MTSDALADPSAWRACSRDESTTRPVFAVGVARSGTTALRNTLERHPRFAPRERGTAETRVFARPERIARILEPEGSALLEFFQGDRQAAAALRDQVAAVRPTWADRLSRSAFRRAGHAHRVRLFFAHARAARGVERMLEKTPAHLFHLAEIEIAYPHSQVIGCVRHPVDVYSSYRKRLTRLEERDRDRSGLEWLEAGPRPFAEEYATAVECLLEAARRAPARVRWITYEALTGDPATQLRELCEFLGEPFASGPLLDDVEVRRDEHGSPRLRARLAPNEKDWKAFLSEAEAREVEDALAPSMQRLGYPRYT